MQSLARECDHLGCPGGAGQAGPCLFKRDLKHACDVPIELFRMLADKFAMVERDRYAIEESSIGESDVIGYKSMWISIMVDDRRGDLAPVANFRLWPRQPGRESGYVGNPSPVFTIRGGGQMVGHRDEVIVDYGYFSKIVISAEGGRDALAIASEILAIAVELSKQFEARRTSV